MEIKTELQRKTVTDLLFRFANGESADMTLQPQDEVRDDGISRYITIIVRDADGKVQAEQRLYRKWITYSQKATREEIVYPAGESPLELLAKEHAEKAKTRKFPVTGMLRRSQDILGVNPEAPTSQE